MSLKSEYRLSSSSRSMEESRDKPKRLKPISNAYTITKKQLKYGIIVLSLVVCFLLGRESKSVNYFNTPARNLTNPENEYPIQENKPVQFINSFLNSSEAVFICDGKYSKRYHLKRTCKGLSSCQGSVIELTLEEAYEKGRNLCGWED